MSYRTTGIARACAVAALVAAASMSSCAYFNTLYNARRIFKEAEKAGATDAAARDQREKFRIIRKVAGSTTRHSSWEPRSSGRRSTIRRYENSRRS
jgi:hypothetical protein